MSTALTLMVSLATLSWLTFLVWYTLRAKWWKQPLGRNIFGVSFIMFVILLRLSLLRIFPGADDPEFSGILVYGAAVVFAVQRIRFMEHAQRESGVS